MGYRSTVVIAVRDNLPIDLAVPQWIVKNCDQSIKKEGFTIYKLDDVKWYTDFDFEEIDESEHWFSNMDQNNSNDFGVIILGEEYGDVTYHGSPSVFDLYIKQFVEVG